MITPSVLQMFKALANLDGSVCLRLDINDMWYVASERIEIGDGFGLTSIGGDHQGTPEKAIESAWRKIADLPTDRYLVVDAMRPTRKHYRWGGFMWVEIPQPAEEARR